MGDCCSKEEATPVERGAPASVSTPERERERPGKTLALCLVDCLLRVRYSTDGTVPYCEICENNDPRETNPSFSCSHHAGLRLWQQNQDDRFQSKIHRRTSPLGNCTKWANRCVSWLSVDGHVPIAHVLPMQTSCCSLSRVA
jgi:hypothetical protein